MLFVSMVMAGAALVLSAALVVIHLIVYSQARQGRSLALAALSALLLVASILLVLDTLDFVDLGIEQSWTLSAGVLVAAVAAGVAGLMRGKAHG